MNIEQLKIILSTNEPTEDMIREFIAFNCDAQYGHLHCLYELIHMTQFNNYQGMQRLNLLIMTYNLLQEFVVMDRILAIPSPSSPASYYQGIMKQITKVYNRVATADKYNKFDHVLNVNYEAVPKGK